MNLPDPAPIRLSSLAHGGGCGCKIAPGVLAEILRHSGAPLVPRELLVGFDTSDDAAVYQINAHQAVVATTDFFTPIVDDPHDFGRIAATNAISDIYAMGATPIFALALVGMPLKVLPLEVIGQIVAGGESVCRAAGIPIAGGHSIDTVEPIYGLVVLGLIDPRNVKRNSDARAGDVLILGKPLGIGIFSAALKDQRLSQSQYQEMLHSTTQLNTPGIPLGQLPDVHAITDVTGFGLLGHLLEVCRGSRLGARLDRASIPVFADTLALAASGAVTGASARNWSGYGHEVDLDGKCEEAWRAVLTDPQTSGGLLVSCSQKRASAVLDIFHEAGFAHAQVIGAMHEGPARVTVG
jgi:selenide, water dikinase